MKKKLENVKKVCYTYEDAQGNLKRTRFFKETSKFILKRKKDSLLERGKIPVQMNKAQWELRMGPINKKRAAPVAHVCDKFKEKTYEMKLATRDIIRRNGKPLAY